MPQIRKYQLTYLLHRGMVWDGGGFVRTGVQRLTESLSQMDDGGETCVIHIVLVSIPFVLQRWRCKGGVCANLRVVVNMDLVAYDQR